MLERHNPKNQTEGKKAGDLNGQRVSFHSTLYILYFQCAPTLNSTYGPPPQSRPSVYALQIVNLQPQQLGGGDRDSLQLHGTEVGSRSLLLINKVSAHHSGPSPAFASNFQGHLALPTPETRDHGINQVSLLSHCQFKSQLSLFCWISSLLLSASQLQKCCCCCLLSRSIFPCGIIALKNIFL